MIMFDHKTETRIGVSAPELVARISAIAERITPDEWQSGRAWYADTRAMAAAMAAESGHTVAQCAAVLAHLSPRTPWARNVLLAWDVIRTGRARTLGRAVNGANEALASTDPLGTLRGPKIGAFGANIAGDETRVTLDVWMLRAFGIDYARLSRVGVYAALSLVLATVAERYGVTPAVLQAAIWINVRGSAD